MKNIPGIWRIKTFAENVFLNYLRHNKTYYPTQNHLIFGSPRGGSTWMMKIIQTITKEPIIWEPLHLRTKNDSFRKLNFGWRQYIPEDVVWGEAQLTFNQLFAGKYIDNSIYKYSNFKQLLFSKSFLIKICRGNLLLPWLTNNFSFNYKPIYMIRHPFAVVSSQLKHGAWNYPVIKFNIPEIPYNQIYIKHEKYLKSLKTKEEMLTANWCITNQLPLNHLNNNINWLTINYEEILVNPHKSLQRILQEWKIQFDLDRIDFSKKSFTTKQGSPIQISKQLGYWKENLNNEQVDRMLKVLEYFNVKVYSKNLEPEIIFNYGLQ